MPRRNPNLLATEHGERTADCWRASDSGASIEYAVRVVEVEVKLLRAEAKLDL